MDTTFFIESYESLCFTDSKVYSEAKLVDEQFEDSLKVFESETKRLEIDVDRDYKKKQLNIGVLKRKIAEVYQQFRIGLKKFEVFKHYIGGKSKWKKKEHERKNC